MSLALAVDADVSRGLVDDGLADGEAEACALYEVVELDETLEDGGLLLLGNTGTGVFAVEIHALSAIVIMSHFSLFISRLLAIADTDVSLVGVLDGIGDEVGEDLLQASLVDIGGIGVVGVVLDKLHTGFLNTLCQCLADVVKDLRKVDMLGFDGDGLSHVGCFEDVVDESEQHVAVVADDADELQSLVLGVNFSRPEASARAVSMRSFSCACMRLVMSRASPKYSTSCPSLLKMGIPAIEYQVGWWSSGV